MTALNVGREYKTKIVSSCLLYRAFQFVDSERVKIWRTHVFINTHKFDFLFIAIDRDMTEKKKK